MKVCVGRTRKRQRARAESPPPPFYVGTQKSAMCISQRRLQRKSEGCVLFLERPDNLINISQNKAPITISTISFGICSCFCLGFWPTSSPGSQLTFFRSKLCIHIGIFYVMFEICISVDARTFQFLSVFGKLGSSMLKALYEQNNGDDETILLFLRLDVPLWSERIWKSSESLWSWGSWLCPAFTWASLESPIISDQCLWFSKESPKLPVDQLLQGRCVLLACISLRSIIKSINQTLSILSCLLEHFIVTQWVKEKECTTEQHEKTVEIPCVSFADIIDIVSFTRACLKHK